MIAAVGVLVCLAACGGKPPEEPVRDLDTGVLNDPHAPLRAVTCTARLTRTAEGGKYTYHMHVIGIFENETSKHIKYARMYGKASDLDGKGMSGFGLEDADGLKAENGAQARGEWLFDDAPETIKSLVCAPEIVVFDNGARWINEALIRAQRGKT